MAAKSFLLSFGIALITGIILFFLSFETACYFSPPYVVDVDGETHGVMPIGQFMVSCGISVALGLIAWVLSYKKIHSFFLRKSIT